MDDEASVSGVSRRRLAFRPPVSSAANKIVLTNDESQAALVLASMESTMISNHSITTTMPSTSSAHNENTDVRHDDLIRKKAAKSWTHDDVMAYYEALKMHGKDFDAVARVLSKRKVMKDKDQIKNYFFNTLKIIKQLLSIDDDDMGDVQKDAKELFLALNACEWKKRTNNGKFISDRLKELLFEGTTTVRINKKMMQIRTPPCPSLVKWFTRSRRVEKMPSYVIFCLEPLSNSVSAFMKSNYHNPLLKIRVSTNERLAKLVEVLQKKWAKKDTNIVVRIWPSFKTEVGKLQVVETDASPFVALSLNKLRKECEEINLAIKSAATNPHSKPSAKNSLRVKPVYNVLYPKPFSLTDEIIKEGICEKNVGKIIVAELYCTCGMTDVINLRYEIEFKDPKRRVEPWQAMLDMVARDYGEASCAPLPMTMCSAMTPNSVRADETPFYERRRESILLDMDNSSNGSTDAQEQPAAKKQKTQMVMSDVVIAENNEFRKQLAGLKRAKMAKHRKKPVKIPPALPQTSTPLPTPTPPTCQIIPKSVAASVESESPAKKTETPKKKANESPKVDFSNIIFSPLKNDNRQLRLNEQFLDSLKTPIKTPKKMTTTELFGDISMSPTMSRKNGPINNHDEETSHCELTDILFGEISSTPTKFMSQTGPPTTFPPTTSTVSNNANHNTSLGFSVTEVQQSFVDMMSSSQDSRDFVLQQFKREGDDKNCKKRL